MAILSSAILNARTSHTSTLIFLHGIGNRYEYKNMKWHEIFDKIRPDHMKVVCPIAPMIPVSMFKNSLMPSWYNISDISKDGQLTYPDPEVSEDLEGLEISTKYLQNLIDAESNNFPNGGRSRIMIGGFSQGAAVVINNLLKSNQTLAGCLILSGYLAGDFAPKVNHKIETPVFQIHGGADKGVSLDKANDASKILKEVVINYEFKIITDLGHEVNDEELELIRNFIYKYLPPIES